MKLMALLSGLILTSHIGGPVIADEIYRCGATGASYSQTPCPNGSRVEMTDSRTDEQRSQALWVAARIAALGATLERDRLAIEAAYRPALAGSLNTSADNTVIDTPRHEPKIKRKRLKSKSADTPKVSIGRHIDRTGPRR